MNNYIKHVLTLATVILSLSSCDLQTDSDEKLPGDEFWTEGTEANMNAFVNSMYYSFRKATMQNAAFILFSGDLRCAPIETTRDLKNNSWKYITALKTNDLNLLRESYKDSKDYRADGIMSWKTFYEVIQQANIMIKEVDNANVSGERKEYYKYESRFARDLTYFFLVRNFGDVPYYTTAYNQTALPRTDMTVVLNNISADLRDMLDSDPGADILPWNHAAMSDRCIKASRGAALALLMHVNMWLAGFDTTNAHTYYQNVVKAGEELVEHNGGNYSLMPISQTRTIFRGGSSESLFEIAQNVSYASGKEVFRKEAVFSNQVMYKCFSGQTMPNIYYPYDYMIKVYETDDERLKYWFDDLALSSVAKNKEIIKFSNPDSYDGGNVTSNSGNQIVFRLADAILLYAEALAELGTNDSKACELLNQVRARSNASVVNYTGDDLKDCIYWERVRELIGEGHYFYDLVRTGKLCDSKYCFNPVTRGNFNRGAWTWPISKSALDNNTHIQLNLYWE